MMSLVTIINRQPKSWLCYNFSDSSACLENAQNLERSGNTEEAKKYYEQAANQGNIAGILNKATIESVIDKNPGKAGRTFSDAQFLLADSSSESMISFRQLEIHIYLEGGLKDRQDDWIEAELQRLISQEEKIGAPDRNSLSDCLYARFYAQKKNKTEEERWNLCQNGLPPMGGTLENYYKLYVAKRTKVR
jgi:TPR repeat protein